MKHPDTWWASYQRRLRFVDGGRDGDLVDCYGMVRLIYAEQLKLDLDAAYGLTLDGLTTDEQGFLKPEFTTAYKPVEQGFEQVFDVAVICKALPVNRRVERGWWHLGVVSKAGHIVHIDYHQGVIEEAFRTTRTATGSATLRSKDVRLFRHSAMLSAHGVTA